MRIQTWIFVHTANIITIFIIVKDYSARFGGWYGLAICHFVIYYKPIRGRLLNCYNLVPIFIVKSYLLSTIRKRTRPYYAMSYWWPIIFATTMTLEDANHTFSILNSQMSVGLGRDGTPLWCFVPFRIVPSRHASHIGTCRYSTANLFFGLSTARGMCVGCVGPNMALKISLLVFFRSWYKIYKSCVYYFHESFSDFHNLFKN